MKSIVFRVDGAQMIGLGHIMRCLAIANRLKKDTPDLKITFMTKYDMGKRIIEKSSYRVIMIKADELNELKEIINGDSILITDFLNTDNRYISKIKSRMNLKIISIDNHTTLQKLDADIIINANVFENAQIEKPDKLKYHIGPKYMILREEFKLTHELFLKKGINDRVSSILVTFGGTDGKGFTSNVVNALEDLSNEININVIIGPGFSNTSNLKTQISRMTRDYNLIFNPNNFIDIMKKTDLAITSAGITLYELATLGIPTVVIPQVSHQEVIANEFEKRGACINLGTNPSSEIIYDKTQVLVNNRDLREKISVKAKSLVDGRGIERISLIIKEFL